MTRVIRIENTWKNQKTQSLANQTLKDEIGEKSIMQKI